MVTDAQVKRLMRRIQTEETLAIAPAKAGIQFCTLIRYACDTSVTSSSFDGQVVVQLYMVDGLCHRNPSLSGGVRPQLEWPIDPLRG